MQKRCKKRCKKIEKIDFWHGFAKIRKIGCRLGG
jgi:hypothetical protein